MKVVIVYDCLYPWRIGGAERWYRSLAEELVGRGHDVTYLTRREWDDPPALPFRVVDVAPREEIYNAAGRRRIGPAVRFGIGTWRYLRSQRDVDVVHSASFPFFSVYGIRLARLCRRKPPLVIDVIEIWSMAYWRSYLGVLGFLGWAVERLALRLADARFALTAVQTRQAPRTEMEVLPGLFDGRVADHAAESPPTPLVVFVGRLIPEKGAGTVLRAVAAVKNTLPDVRCELIGDGPERQRLEALAAELQISSEVSFRGFVPEADLHQALSAAHCVLLPSRREGYGLIVVEAAALGTPTITLAVPENAAATLIENGVNGWTVPSDDPDEWAQAIVRAVTSPDAKDAALAWGKKMAAQASVRRSCEVIEHRYRSLQR